MLGKMSYEINLIFTAMIIIIVSLISFLFLVSLLTKKKIKNTNTNTTQLQLPPGPRKLPIIGNLHQIRQVSPRSLQHLSKEHGDLMFLQLGFAPTLVVSSADRAREIFKSHDQVFSGRSDTYSYKKLSYDYSGIGFAPYGDYWRELRKVTALKMMTPKRIQSFGNVRVQEVASMMDRIGASDDRAVDLSSLAFLLAENVVSRVIFGKSTTADEAGTTKRGELQDMIHRLQNLGAEFNVADYFPWMGWINSLNGVDTRLDEAASDLDRFINKIIDEHLDPMRPQPSDHDLIDVLIGIHKDPCPTITITNSQIKGVLLDIFIAAIDTSSTTIAYTMAELIRHPSVKQMVEQEVRRVAKGKAQVDETDLLKLTYLKQVIKETLRLHPPFALIIRETTDSCTIGNKYHIPAKTRVLLNVPAISTDPEHWKNPEEFWPERFVDSEVDFKGMHYELLPFGTGRRVCPGINFATALLELALANLVFRFDWKLPEGMLAEDLDMEAFGLGVSNKAPLCLVASVPIIMN